MYKQKFTQLQQEMLGFFFSKPKREFTERSLAKQLNVSPTAVSNSLPLMKSAGLLKVSKDRESGRLSISLNRENPRTFFLKRAENLRAFYESGLSEYLSEKFPGSTIILFGSYSFGEDTEDSDIDIAIIGSKRKDVDTKKFESTLERRISINFYDAISGIEKNLRENILNGIVMDGGVTL